MGEWDHNILHCSLIVADLDNSLVWVYFHSNVREYNRLECWGPLVEAAKVLPELSALHWFPCTSCFKIQNLSTVLHKIWEYWSEIGIKSQGADEAKEAIHHAMEEIEKKWPKQLWPGKTCEGPCECCSRHGTLIPVPKTFELLEMQEEQRRST